MLFCVKLWRSDSVRGSMCQAIGKYKLQSLVSHQAIGELHFASLSGMSIRRVLGCKTDYVFFCVFDCFVNPYFHYI